MTHLIRTFAVSVALAAGVTIPLSPLAAQEVGPPVPADVAGESTPEGVEVMTRGVVHEAFAEVITDPKPGLTVSKRPPEAIDEVPPEFKPEEEGAIWITGYWVWDDEKDDFFWQSGVWRIPPPGMRWVAGYWNEVPGGWQWVSGFWLPIETKEVRYYDAPPASLEAGPTSPSPGDNYFWATGSWTYYDTGYRWQPGYWSPYQEDWVWISPRYCWTPAGYVYLPGRWDYRLTRRGCLFAPVYFTQPIYLRPRYVYRPWCALNTPNLFVHLWVRPNYCHFYFGNYYGSNWGNWGVTPWCHYRPYRNCYDPVLTHLQCHYRRGGVNYINRLDGWHNHYASNAGNRPPRTWNEQVQIVNKTKINNTNITNINQNILAVNLKDADHRKDLPVKLARLDGDMHQKAVELAKETRDVRQHRISVEHPAAIQPDLAKGEIGKRPGKDSDAGEHGPRPGPREHVRLQLPETKAVDFARQPEKIRPPKLPQPVMAAPMVELPGNSHKNRPKADAPHSPANTKLPLPMPSVKTPTPRPSGDTPKPQPKVELPKPQPKTESPHPRRENPVPPPRVNVPRPQVETPRSKPEAPRERPQIRLDIPKPSPRIQPSQPHAQPASLSRVQPAPRVEMPRSNPPRSVAPRSEPRGGGENRSRDGRNKPD